MSIYEPAEDSYLMIKCLKKKLPAAISKNPDLKFLEIGCGSGVILEAAFKLGIKKNNILGVDINPEAVEHCKDLEFNSLVSDLFDSVNGKWDIVVFNPPYLPEDEMEPESSRVATTGGEKGHEIIVRFLEQAEDYVTGDGRIFVVTSSLAANIDFDELGYNAEEIFSEKMFFEQLVGWELRKK